MLMVDGKEVYTTIDEIVQPRHTALLLIDIQRDFYDEDGLFASYNGDVSRLKAALPRMRDVLEEARAAGVLVIFVQHVSYANHLTDSPVWIRFQTVRYGLPPNVVFQLKDSRGGEIMPEVAPRPDELIVTKHRSSAFIGTDLDMILRSNAIKSVVVIGDVTQGCIESTARDAAFFDYYPVVLNDAVASLDARLHEASLFVMASRFDVTDAAEVFETWRANPNPARAVSRELATSSVG